MSDSFVWWRDGVIYQIYPRSFSDSNQDGIGDINGITARLDYLADLGVDALWLSPIYPSPDVDFGYDVSDYTAIDPRFGTMADFDRLVNEAHTRGIRIILDLVLNHTSNQHPWFQQSRLSRDNPYRDYYIWRNPAPGGRPPNHWQAVFGGSAWEWDPKTGQYYYHMFYAQQPDVNWRNPAVRAAMLDVFRFWMDRGVDGFRLDVFNVYFKDDELRRNPRTLRGPYLGLRPFDRQKHIFDTNRPELFPLLAEIRGLLDSYPERYAVGETFLSTPTSAAQYTGPDRLHAAFNFRLLECPWNPARILRAVEEWEAALGPAGWPTQVLNNHDQVRSATRYRCGKEDERLKVAAALLLTLRGTPFIYYGEEIGMRNLNVPREMIQDPIGRRYWPFHPGRDGCRGPMQWNAARNAGFTNAIPWLPTHPDYPRRNVQAQQGDPDSLLNFYRRLIRLRRELPALRSGQFMAVHHKPGKILAYLRRDGEQNILVALNFSARPARLTLPTGLSGTRWSLVLSSHDRLKAFDFYNTLELAGYEALILSLAA